jgi:hypothetical protein
MPDFTGGLFPALFVLRHLVVDQFLAYQLALCFRIMALFIPTVDFFNLEYLRIDLIVVKGLVIK